MDGIWVACARCHKPYPAETHAGLVRCAECKERTAFVLPHTPATVVEVSG